MRKMTLLIALALLQVPALGWAKSKKTETPAETPVLTYRFEQQLNRLDQRVAKLLGDKQKDLRHMAEASVLADFCPAYQVDQDRFKRDFDSLAAPTAGKPRKPAEQRDFVEKVKHAIDALAKIPGIGEDVAAQLVHSGFSTLEGIREAEPEDLAAIEGFDPERARAIIEIARTQLGG